MKQQIGDSAPMKALFAVNRERHPERRDAIDERALSRVEWLAKRVLVLCAGLAVCTWAPGAFAQQRPVPKGHVDVIPLHQLPTKLRQAELDRQSEVQRQAAAANQPSTAAALTTWTYSVVAYDGKTYTGAIMGRSPYYHGKTGTPIPTQIIPLIITITDSSGTVVYDPTQTETTCVPFHTAVDIITGSPLFSNHDWVMDGIKMSQTQYDDATVRAEFWSLVGGTPYRLLLQQSMLPTQSLTFAGTGVSGSSGPGSNFNTTQTGACESVGVVNETDIDNAIQALVTGNGPLAGLINIGTVPLFLTRNVVEATSGTNLFSNCCALGYHSAFNVGQNTQVYGIFEVDTAKFFGSGYTDTMAHEVAEAINDPYANNTAPSWGAEGQIVAGSCDTSFEVGDPLSEGYSTPTKPFTLTQNGLAYSLQETAFFSWFFGDPDLGVAGYYSNNGTFTGYAKACPPGGTN